MVPSRSTMSVASGVASRNTRMSGMVSAVFMSSPVTETAHSYTKCAHGRQRQVRGASGHTAAVAVHVSRTRGEAQACAADRHDLAVRAHLHAVAHAAGGLVPRVALLAL